MLGRVVEKITGQPYAAYVRNSVLKRCSINDMTIAGNTLAQHRPEEAKYYGRGRPQSLRHERNQDGFLWPVDRAARRICAVLDARQWICPAPEHS